MSMEKILPQLFEEQVANHPNQTALIFQGKEFTYQEINKQANKIAYHLREIGVSNNHLIGVCLEASPELLITILGILKAGGAYIPLDPYNPSKRLKLIIEDSKQKILITSSIFSNQFENHLHLSIIYLDKMDLSNQPFHNPNQINVAADLAYIIYTSGSTAKPKGVMITHKNLHHFISWFSDAIEIKNEYVFDFASSISFDFAVTNTLFPLMTGAKVAICPESYKRDPYLYVKYLLDSKVSIIKFTPSHFRQFKEVVLSENISFNFKYIVFGGELLRAKDIRDWIKRFPKQILFCEYGPTEATVATSWIKINKDNIAKFPTSIPIGNPVKHSQFYILDERLKLVPHGELGELYIGGDGIAAGYLHNDTETKKSFISNPFAENEKIYKTGDMCRRLSNDDIEFVERLDHQIKIRGFRIEISEIENCLLSYPGIKETIIIVRDIRKNEEKQLIAYLVPNRNEKIDLHKLRNYLKENLPHYMVPAFLLILEKMPLAASNKIDIQQLPDPSSLVAREQQSYSETELMLKKIWADVLDIKNIGVEENFFDLGGHSLAAARIINKIRKKTKKEIRLEEFYQTPTIKNLSNILDQKDEIADNTFNINKKYKKNAPLNELQLLFYFMLRFYPKARVINIVSRKQVRTRIDKALLTEALAILCQRHPILCYHIPQHYPIQIQQSKTSLNILEYEIDQLPIIEQEDLLIKSLLELENLTWQEGRPLIEIRLFHLDNSMSEIQISMSHFISDEMSAEIAFSELSRLYLLLQEKNMICAQPDTNQYIDYVLQENKTFQINLNSNLKYWEQQLNEASVLSFPNHCVCNNNAFSTSYIEIPNKTIEHLQYFCSLNKISITDCLCAAVSIVLKNYLQSSNKILALALVKSTRNNEIYDNVIGLFVRSDMIKVNLNHSSNLLSIAKQIQSFAIDSSSYQSCPIIIKLGCLLKREWTNKKILDVFIRFLAKTYSLIFYKSRLNHQLLTMLGRLYSARNKQQYFVNVNIMNRFITEKKNTHLFGHELKETKTIHSDKIVNKDILNIWFDKDTDGKSYLILSGNFTAGFRRELSEKIINVIFQSESSDALTHT